MPPFGKELFIPQPVLDPGVADDAPCADAITPYDEEHFVTYARLLDAEAEEADWRDVCRIVLHRDPDAANSRQCWQSHIDRAHWMVEHGYRQLLDRTRGQ